MSTPATVTITITNQAPTAGAQTVTGNAPTTATPITLTASDPNGDALTYSVTEEPTKGDVSCSGSGECTYVADPSTSGTDSFQFTADDGFAGTSTATVTIQLDSTTPGVFLGATEAMEQDAAGKTRGVNLPLTLSHPSPVPLTVWYYTVDGTATGAAKSGTADYTRFGTASRPRSITFPAGATWQVIAAPVSGDTLIEGDETFSVHISAVTGGAAYVATPSTDITIRDADSVIRTDPSVPLLTVTSITQHEGNARDCCMIR